jgi:hypothetical protein
MLSPSSFITVNPLEDFSIRYGNSLDKFVAQKIFPVHPVPKKTGSFYSYGKDNLRVQTLDAPSGVEASKGQYTVSSKTFTCKEKAFKQLVLGKDARDFDRPVADLDTEAAMLNMEALMLEMEVAAHTKATTSTNYPAALVTTLTDSVDRWSDAGGDPLENVRASRQAVFEACGKRPQKMAISQKTLDILKLNPVIIDRVKYTSAAAVTAQVIAALLELDELFISDVIKNTAMDGATDSLTSVWGDSAVLLFQDPGARLKSMTYGKCFMVNRLYSLSMDKPELGRSEGAHEIESGWEYTLESCATVSSSDDDFVAGALIANVF